MLFQWLMKLGHMWYCCAYTSCFYGILLLVEGQWLPFSMLIFCLCLFFLIIHNMFHHWCCYRCWSVASFFLCFSCWSFFLVVSLTVTHHIEECVPYIHAIGCANYTCRSPVSFRHSSIHIDCYVYMCAYVLFRIQRCQIGLHGKVRALEVRWWLSLGPTCIMAAQLKSWWIIVSLHQLSGKLVSSDQY